VSKAIAGAAMIAADLAIGVAFFLDPALIPLGVVGFNVLNSIMVGLFAGGVSMEAGALAQALTSNRGENITTRLAAGLRQIIYGMQRVGGNMIYLSTTGAAGHSGNYVYNYVITVATHEIDAFMNVYLDGRQVFWRQDGNAANVGCGTVAHPFTCTASVNTADPPVNQLGNPTFDFGASGWTLQTGWALVTGAPWSAGNMAQFTGPGTALAANSTAMPATAGVQFHATCQARGDVGATGIAVLQLTFWDAGGAAIGSPVASIPVNANNSWGTISVTATAPAGVDHCNCDFAVYGETSATAHWDCTQFFADDVSGQVTAIAVSGTGSGFSNVKAARYRVRIWGGGGSGATAYATNSGTATAPVFTVHLTAGGSGYTSPPFVDIQGAYVFGGVAAADEQDPFAPGYGSGYGISPSGEHYNFSGKVFCEARFGDQAADDYMASLTANDSTWPTTANVGGCAYLYLNVGYDTQLFQAPPEIRITVQGKNSIYDPRSGRTGYSTNWALQVADVLTDPLWGLGDGAGVNTAQLVAAANVCDEMVTTSQGAEARYTQHIHYDTSMGPGDVLQMMMPTAAGRLSRIGGEWFIWPAAWIGPSYAFDQSALIDAPSWTPYRSYKELFNRVNGTYIAPNFPYSVAGNLYDKNGWYYGTRDNVWPFAWQPTNFPQYAADPLHGYAADEYLAQDGGNQLPHELSLRGVISITQAQRVAKITLMRNRFQGVGSFRMSLAAWQLQPVDVVEMSWNMFGWTGHLLEVTEVQFICEALKRDNVDNDETLALSVQVAVQETDPTIYQWSPIEELTPYDVPAESRQIPTVPAPPTVFTVTSSAGTAIIGADGIVIPRARLDWNAPLDISVTMIQIQYQLAGAADWIEAGAVDVALFHTFVSGVVAGDTYNFRIRSIRRAGVWSAWVEVDGAVISITLSNTTGVGYSVAPAGTLSAQALSDGTAQITVSTFTAVWGGLSVFCSPSPHILGGLNQSQLYYVYYVDPTFAGGAITPIATTNPGDFSNHVGYFLIGSIVTPSYTPRYQPTTYHDAGTNSTQHPAAAYDNDVTTDALVQATLWSVYNAGVGLYIPSTAAGDCIWSGFPAFTSTGPLTLHCVFSADVFTGTTTTMTVTAHVGATDTNLATLYGTTAQADYTLAIPTGTALNTISVEAAASITAPGPSSTNLSQYAHLEGFEIWIA
jgi:hypothetical protein